MLRVKFKLADCDAQFAVRK